MGKIFLKEKSILSSDIKIVGFSIFFASLIYIGAIEFNFHSILLYFCISVTSILLLTASMDKEEIFKNEKILNSLPISKEEIVGSRYIGTILITLITTLFFAVNVIIMGVVLLGGNELFRLIDIKEIIVAISFVMLVASFNIPLYYSKYSKTRSLVFGVPSILLIGSYLNYSLNWNIGGLILLLKKPFVVAILLGVSLLLYYLSYELSKKIYISKEF